MQASGTPVGGARPGWLRAIMIQCLVLAVTLTACEMILRIVDLRYLRMDESGIAPVYGHDAALGWCPIPNSAQTYSGARSVHVRHNSIGLRDIEPEATQKPTIAFGGKFLVGLQKRDARFEAFFRAQNIRFATFENAEAYPTHGNHWTPKGNAQVAERLAALLGENGILPAAQPDAGSGEVATSSVQLRN